MGQFISFMKQVREVNPSVEVERVMALVLKKNDIDISLETMMEFNKDFAPADKISQESR